MARTAVGLTVVAATTLGSAAPGPARRASVPTRPSAGATLADSTGRGRIDAYVSGDRAGQMTLRTFSGRTMWRLRAGPVAVAPRVVAAGDFTDDRVPDYVFWLLRPAGPAATCGGTRMDVSELVFVDGRSGRHWRPAPRLGDLCWDTPEFNYPTHQWEYSTVYVGDFSPRYGGNEVVTVPYYATEGMAWNFAARHRWQRVRGRGGATAFEYPSTPSFDGAYNHANAGRCSQPRRDGRCYFPYSHVANSVFVPGGLFTLTSMRAVLYRPDLTPTSDVTWIPGGTPENTGRNYGLVTRFRSAGRSYVDLVGGCGVGDMQSLMRGGAWDRHCGIVHHLERFEVRRGRILGHRSVYYGFSHTDGFLEGRVEFPRRAHTRLAPHGATAALFNVYRGGAWAIEVFARPDAARPIRLRGWFLWDTADLDADGASELLATRVGRSFVPPREFSVLSWTARHPVVRGRVRGVVPALLPYASTPAEHSSEGNISGTMTRGREILVEDAAGDLRWWRWSRGS